MTVRKCTDADKEIFAEFIKATWFDPIPFDKDAVANSLTNNPNNRNYIVFDDNGNVIGGGCWAITGDIPVMRWAIMKDSTFKLDNYMALIHKCVSDCLDEGYKTGNIPTNQKWLGNLLQAQFSQGVTIQEIGFKPNSKEAIQWNLQIDLQQVVDKLDQLAKGG